MVNSEKNIAKILTTLCVIMVFIISITIKVSFSTTDNDSSSWNISLSDFSNQDNILLNNTKFYFHSSISIENYNDNFSFYVNNSGDFDAYLNDYAFKQLSSTVVGVYNGIEYYANDFINFNLYYDEDGETSVNIGDYLNQNTFKQIYVVVELKPSYELTDEELYLLNEVGSIELDLSVSLDYQQSI